MNSLRDGQPVEIFQSRIDVFTFPNAYQYQLVVAAAAAALMTIAMFFFICCKPFLQRTLKQLTQKSGLRVKSVDGTEEIFTPKSGKTVFIRKLLKVTYWPPRFPKSRPKKMKLDSKFGLGHVLIECGHTPHKAFEKYPDVLCGQYKQTYGWFL